MMADKPTIYRVLRLWANQAKNRKGITVQIDIPEGAALPRELVSLADYEAEIKALYDSRNSWRRRWESNEGLMQELREAKAKIREQDAHIERVEQLHADSHLAALDRADAAAISQADASEGRK